MGRKARFRMYLVWDLVFYTRPVEHCSPGSLEVPIHVETPGRIVPHGLSSRLVSSATTSMLHLCESCSF